MVRRGGADKGLSWMESLREAARYDYSAWARLSCIANCALRNFAGGGKFKVRLAACLRKQKCAQQCESIWLNWYVSRLQSGRGGGKYWLWVNIKSEIACDQIFRTPLPRNHPSFFKLVTHARSLNYLDWLTFMPPILSFIFWNVEKYAAIYKSCYAKTLSWNSWTPYIV